MAWGIGLFFVVVGAALQRVTGLGFALVSGPLLVLILNPFDGIVLANILSGVVAAWIILRSYKFTNWAVAGKLCIGVVLGVPIGAAVVFTLDQSLLLIFVGAITAFAVMLVIMHKNIRVLGSKYGAVIAGLVSGFSNVTAGVGGPALAMYGVAQAMPMLVFIPTIQVVGFVTNVLSIAAKQSISIELPMLLAAIGCVVVGLGLGTVLRRWISGTAAQRLALILALGGSAAAVVRGVISLL